MASTFTEGFEGGSLGASLTTSNTGFTLIQLAAGGSPYFGNDSNAAIAPHRGTYCAVFDATAENCYGQKAITATGTTYVRFYIYVSSAPGAIMVLASARSSSTARAQIRLGTDRTLQLRNGTTAVWTSTNAVPLNQWARVEWRLVNGTAQQLRLYTGANVDSASTTLEDSGNQTFNTGTFDNIQYGVVTATSAVFALDELAHDDATWVGPSASGTTTVTPARVSATAAVNSVTVTVGGNTTVAPSRVSAAAAVPAATTGQATTVALRNGFETGTDEATITAAGSGGSGHNAFDLVTIGTSATAVYDTAQAAHGTASGRFATGGTAAVSYVQWDQASMGDITEGWWRFYVRFDSIPTASRFIAQWRHTTGSVTCASLQILSTGVLAIQDTAGEIFRSTFALSADTWYRVEVHLAFSVTTGRADMWIYDVPESATAVDTQSSAANRNLDPSCNRFRIGLASSAANQPALWLDEVAYSTTGKIGPVATVATPATAGPGIIAATASIPTAAPAAAGTGRPAPQTIAASTSFYLPAAVGGTGGGSAIQWGSTCNYGPTEGISDDASYTRFRGELAPLVLDFFHGYTSPAAGGIPTTVAGSSGLTIAKNQGRLDVELNIKTDWVSNGAIGPWLTRLTQLMDAIKAEGPTWTPTVRFVINHEPDNGTADPTTNRALAEQQAGFWRSHVVAVARHIWARNDPQFMAQITFMGFTGRVRNDGTRVAKWLEFDPHWDAPFTAFEKANKIIVGGDVYPRLDANGNISLTLNGEDNRMAAQCRIFDIFHAMGYRRFAFSEYAYNTELCTTTQEPKVRDAIRGYTSTGAVVPGSLGDYLRTTTHNIEFFSWYESTLNSLYDPLHTSATRMQGFKDLVNDFRAGGSEPAPPVPANPRPAPLVARAGVPVATPQTSGAITLRPAVIAALAGVNNVALVTGAITFDWDDVVLTYADWSAVVAGETSWQTLMDGIVSGGTSNPHPAAIGVTVSVPVRIPGGDAVPAVTPPPPPAPPPTIPTSGTVTSVSARWDAVVRSSQVVELRVDAYRYSAALNRQVLLASDLPIEPDSATITMDGESEARRTCELVIADPSLVPVSPLDILTPHGTELHIRRGFRYPDGVVEMVPVGVFRIDRPSTPILGAVKVSGVDRSRLIAEDRFLHATQSVAGATVIAEIARLIYNSYPGGDVPVINTLSDTTVCRRTTWEADTSPWEAIQELALSIDADVGVDRAGQFVIRRMPQLTDEPVWTIDIGQTGVLIGGTEEWDRERVYNAVVARSEPTDGSAPLQHVAYDLNPSSPTYWHGTFGHRPRSYSSPLLQSVGACAAAANTILRKTTAPARTLRVECVPNPALDFGDVVTVVLPPLDDRDVPRVEQHMVWSYTMPLGLGAMELNLYSSNPGGQ